MYDYIISGAGCAGLSLAVNMILSGGFSGKRILLADKAPKRQNDRTWCFWENGPGLFEPVVYRQWDKLWFHGSGYSTLKETGAYRYKMIRSLDFYNYCFGLIDRQPNIEIRYGVIHSACSDENETFIRLDGEKIRGKQIFNSIPFGPEPQQTGYHHLLQHFKGWVIKTPEPRFIPGEATLMDFRVSQELGTTFVYVMPFAPDEALVEYTLFSQKTAPPSIYEQGLKDYLREITGVVQFEILEEEYGVIPMTNQPFAEPRHQLFPIGTAGGCTKPSSGYTFQFIQKQSRSITAALLSADPPQAHTLFRNKKKNRYLFYDSVLLNVLANGKLKGERIFTDLFRSNRPEDIFNFLDNESSWLQDLRIIRSLPAAPFFKAACQEVLH